MGEKEIMLVSKAQYLTAGIHIGMKSCTPYLRQFVYKVRDDGLAVFNLQLVDQRIQTAARFLSRFRKPLVVSRKDAAGQAVTAFSAAIGGRVIAGRFAPGTLTNPSFRDFFEPDVIIIVDPQADAQAVTEAITKRVPIVALADTFNTIRGIDLIVPANNNGKRSIALVFWALAREILRIRGTIPNADDFTVPLQDFGGEIAKETKVDEEEIIKSLEQENQLAGEAP